MTDSDYLSKINAGITVLIIELGCIIGMLFAIR